MQVRVQPKGKNFSVVVVPRLTSEWPAPEDIGPTPPTRLQERFCGLGAQLECPSRRPGPEKTESGFTHTVLDEVKCCCVNPNWS
jgi:hypothetical protein